jgi:diaminopimelate epimerase
MHAVPFVKMHGLGNDFVVVDARTRPLSLTPAAARRIADRHTGVGCDQIILIEPPGDGRADAFMRILNADGGEVGACGNATRCVARLLLRERGGEAGDTGRIVIETQAGRLACDGIEGGLIRVDMGPVRRAWNEIPLRAEADTLHLPLRAGPLADAVAVNVGNPHAVFFVADADAVPLAELGPAIETDAWFPERTNVEVVTVLAPERLRMRVWERGAGITRACGSGACAALAAAHARGLAAPAADVALDGGTLHIALSDDGRVRMTGPAALSFCGELPPALLG